MDAERFSTLTEAQRQCLRLYAAPMRAKQVAVEMGVTTRAAEGLLARATEKIGAASSADAARAFAAFERASGYKTPVHFSPVAAAPEPTETNNSGTPPEAASPPGRNIRFGSLQRTGIILGLTAAMILSLLAVVAISEGITRLVRAYYSNTS